MLFRFHLLREPDPSAAGWICTGRTWRYRAGCSPLTFARQIVAKRPIRRHLGGPFRADAANAAGYAVGGALNPDGSPAILVAGFDLQESHLVEEATDLDEVPAVTASDVVDRATLKAFVDRGDRVLRHDASRPKAMTAAMKRKRVFRDPDGPWRRGSRLPLRHGSQRLHALSRGVPGEVRAIKPPPIPSETLSPESSFCRKLSRRRRATPEGGGFVEYHFDDPDDDTDSAEVPKVTYADALIGTPPMGPAAGAQTLIVGAGIYGDPVSKESTAAAKDWLSRFGRVVAGQAVDMIGSRLASPFSGQSQVKIAGQTLNLRDLLSYEGPAVGFAPGTPIRGYWDDAGGTSQSLSVQDILLGSSFHLSSTSDGSGAGGQATIWGQAALTRFDDGALSTDGDVITGMLGADYDWGRILAGVAVSHSVGDGGFEPESTAELRSRMEASLTSVYPYFRVALGEGWSAWGLAGYGTGEMSLDEEHIEKRVETDITMATGALGLRGDILSTSGPAGFGLALKSDVLLMRIESDEEAGLPSIEARGTQFRLGLEGSRPIALEQGGILRPWLELGVRFESGDAEQGTGLELGGGLRFSDPGSRVSVEARGRGLVVHSGDDDYGEWGVGGSISLQPGAMGRGLSLSVASSWGEAFSGTDALWSRPGDALLGSGDGAVLRGRLSAELGYGLGTTGGRGLLTPHAGMALSSGGGRDWRMGWRYRFGSSLHLNLQGVRREGAANSDGPDHGVTLHGVARW